MVGEELAGMQGERGGIFMPFPRLAPLPNLGLHGCHVDRSSTLKVLMYGARSMNKILFIKDLTQGGYDDLVCVTETSLDEDWGWDS